MRTYRKELHFNFADKTGLSNITNQIQNCVRESGIQEGLLLVNAMSTTAAVLINDEEPLLQRDFKGWLEQMVPEAPIVPYKHNEYKKNTEAHIKQAMLGRGETIGITKGELDLGTWEQVFYMEFDGGRDKRVLIKIIGNV